MEKWCAAVNIRIYNDLVSIHTNGTYTPDAADASNSGRRIEPNLYNWLKSKGYLD